MGYDMWGAVPIICPRITGLGRCPPGPYWTCPGGSITGAPTAGACPIICCPGYIPGCIPPCIGCPVAAPGPGVPVIGPCPCWAASPLFTLVMSWMLDLRLSLLMEFNLMKYFCAWLATCVGVLEITKFRDILRQSPFPNLFSPNKNSLHIPILRQDRSFVTSFRRDPSRKKRDAPSAHHGVNNW